MMDDISDDMKPVYKPYKPIHKGICQDGPMDRKLLESTNLTEFIQRKVERKSVDYNGRSLMGLSEQERSKLIEAEKALMKETLWAKKHPHRYDFDIDRQMWVYVEYIVTPLEGEE